MCISLHYSHHKIVTNVACLTLKGPGIFTVFHVGASLKLQIGM